MNIFTDTSELVDLSMRMMRIVAVDTLQWRLRRCFRVSCGAGDTVTPMWLSLITTIFLRVPTAYGLAYLTRSPQYPNGRPESLFVSLLIAWVLGAAITFFFYKKGDWRNKALLQNA